MTDTALLARVRQRDEQALALLYDRYSGTIYTLAIRMLSIPSAAETIVAEVFKTLWLTAADLDPAIPFYAWVIEVARRHVRAATRSPKMLNTMPGDLAAPDHEPSGSPRMTQPNWLFQRAQAMRGALAALSNAQRQTLEHVYYGGMTCAAVAALSGESVNTVKLQLREGLLQLANGVRADG